MFVPDGGGGVRPPPPPPHATCRNTRARIIVKSPKRGHARSIASRLDRFFQPNIRSTAANVLAPFFFASIGLRIDFAANFGFGTILGLVAIACLGKVLGASWGARLGGMDPLSAWAVGFAMNARGAMEIVLSALALRSGLIGNPMFVALVVMALFTSLISAPVIQQLMKRNTSTRRAREGPSTIATG